jgi:hypothetical protein
MELAVSGTAIQHSFQRANRLATLQQELQQFESSSSGSTTGNRPSYAQTAGGTLNVTA